MMCPSPEFSIPPTASLHANICGCDHLEEFLFSHVSQFSMTPLHVCGTEILRFAPCSFVFILAVLS